jgi:hypothetical protein
MAVRLWALRACRALPLSPGTLLVFISVRGWVNCRTIMRLEGLCRFNIQRLHWESNRDLPAQNIQSSLRSSGVLRAVLEVYIGLGIFGAVRGPHRINQFQWNIFERVFTVEKRYASETSRAMNRGVSRTNFHGRHVSHDPKFKAANRYLVRPEYHLLLISSDTIVKPRKGVPSLALQAVFFVNEKGEVTSVLN